VIRGLSIGDGTGTPQKIYLEVDSDKTCYVVLPNGTLLTSTSGVINYDWEGVAGNVKLIVPKDTTDFRVINGLDTLISDFGGNATIQGNYAVLRFQRTDIVSLEANNTVNVSINNNAVITTFSANNAIDVNASACALTDKSIGDFLIAASVNNPTANGSADFSGGTNALFANIALYMHSIGVIGIPNPPALSAWLTANLSTWSLTFRLV